MNRHKQQKKLEVSMDISKNQERNTSTFPASVIQTEPHLQPHEEIFFTFTRPELNALSGIFAYSKNLISAINTEHSTRIRLRCRHDPYHQIHEKFEEIKAQNHENFIDIDEEIISEEFKHPTRGKIKIKVRLHLTEVLGANNKKKGIQTISVFTFRSRYIQEENIQYIG